MWRTVPYTAILSLQWPSNRKSYMIYRTALFSMTLNDHYPQLQRHAILWRWISQKQYEIQTQCHWNTNRDLHTPYAAVSFWMTWVILSDLAKSSITWNTARSLWDSWASCCIPVSQYCDSDHLMEASNSTGHEKSRFSSTNIAVYFRFILSVLTGAARVIIGKCKYDHITYTMRRYHRHDLHWLPVRQRIQCKLCTLVSKCLRRTAQSYLADMCIPVSSTASRQHLRPAAHHDLTIPRSRLARYGSRSFATSDSSLWN